MTEPIPQNERPTWMRHDEQQTEEVASQFEPLGERPSPPAERPSEPGGWQAAPPVGDTQPKQQSEQPWWGWGDKNTQQDNWDWIWYAVAAFFLFGGWSWFGDLWSADGWSWFGDNWWWLLWLWWPISAFVKRTFNVENHVVVGTALFIIALTFLLPGEAGTGTWLGLGLVGLGLLTLFRK